MVVGTPRGQADGFHLELLDKLSDTKDSLSGKSVVYHLVSYMTEQHPDSLAWTADLVHTPQAAKIDLNEVNECINALRQQLKGASQSSSNVTHGFVTQSLFRL